MDIKREYSLRVSKDYNEVDGVDRLGHSIWFNHKDSDISESAYFVLGDKEPFVKAIFDVNHNNPSNKVPYYSIFKEALDYISKVFFQDKDVLVAFEGLPFNAKYALHNYAIAYIALYSWMELSKDFEAQHKKMWLDGIEYLDEVYINEFIDKILADETECVCDVNLYTLFHDKMTSKDLKPLTQPGQWLYQLEMMLDNKIVSLSGGVPIFEGEHLLGSIGVSGGNSIQDQEIALYAIDR